MGEDSCGSLGSPRREQRPAASMIAPNVNTPPVLGLADVCSCGNVFMPDAIYCRKCGKKRPGATAPNFGDQRSSATSGTLRASSCEPTSLQVSSGAGCPRSAAPAPELGTNCRQRHANVCSPAPVPQLHPAGFAAGGSG